MSESLHPIATKVVYEDDYVRVWHQQVPAGGRIERHLHEHDYFLVNVAGNGPLDVTFHEGTGGELGDAFTFEPQPGRSVFIPKGHMETAHNRGEEYRAVLVELKKPKDSPRT
ncbi:MAG: hypothetical protein HKP27_05290 [Myxococcales bacterium]|nr:hypothetical protein [Myxococcales bacterium]